MTAPLWSAGRRIVGFAAATAVAQLVSGALYVLGARALGPVLFGPLAAAMAASLLLGATFDFGLNQLLTRQVAAGRLPAAAAAALVARKRVLAAGLVVLVAAAGFVVHREPVLPILLGLLAWSLWESQNGTAALRAQHRLRAVAITQLAGRTVGLGVGAAVLPVSPAVGLVGGCVLGYLAEAGAAQLAADGFRRPAARRALWSAQRDAVGFGLTSLGSAAQQLATPLVALGAGAYGAGIYAAANRFVSPLHMVSWAVGSVCVPSLARAHRSPGALPAEERKTLVMAGFFALLPAAATLLGPLVLPVLLGPAFGGASAVFAVLAGGVIISTVNQGCMNIIHNRGGQTAVALVYAGAVPAGLAGTFLLAAAGGPFAAAWASVATQLAVSAGLGWNLSGRSRSRRKTHAPLLI